MMVTESVSVNIYVPLTDVIRHHLPSLSSSEVFNYLVTHIFLFVKKKKEKTKKKQTSPPILFFFNLPYNQEFHRSVPQRVLVSN